MSFPQKNPITIEVPSEQPRKKAKATRMSVRDADMMMELDMDPFVQNGLNRDDWEVLDHEEVVINSNARQALKIPQINEFNTNDSDVGSQHSDEDEPVETEEDNFDNVECKKVAFVCDFFF
ncbi:hypothetical protein G6F56_014126 [Rhizopus delemar]|nr:hypothetical protein G6F56_014126 [Rhizopus delemar]